MSVEKIQENDAHLLEKVTGRMDDTTFMGNTVYMEKQVMELSHELKTKNVCSFFITNYIFHIFNPYRCLLNGSNLKQIS